MENTTTTTKKQRTKQWFLEKERKAEFSRQEDILCPSPAKMEYLYLSACHRAVSFPC